VRCTGGKAKASLIGPEGCVGCSGDPCSPPVRASVEPKRVSDLSFKHCSLGTERVTAIFVPSLSNSATHLSYFIKGVIMAGCQILPSTRSLEADPYTKSFGTSATPSCLGNVYSDYGFIAVLGLAQRLKIDLLPITWQALRGLVGQSRARINQALLSIQTSFAFKRFDHDNQSDPFRETVQEMAILGHPLVQGHPHIVNLIGICWDIEENSETLKEDQDISADIQIWPVLVFEKSHLGDLYSFARSSRGKALSVENRLKICADISIAIRDMHLNSRTAI
jgi:hypothetical protein